MDEDAIVDKVEAAINAASGAGRVAGALMVTLMEYVYADSWGVEKRGEASMAHITVRVLGDGDLAVTRTAVGRRVGDLDAEGAASEAAELLRRLRGLRRVPVRSGEANLVLDPMVVVDLMNYVSHYWLSAYSVVAGLSRFSQGDVGGVVGSEVLTLVDSAEPGDIGVLPFDWEGQPPRRNVIIERGVLRGFIHNASTAAKLGAEPTGNAIGVSGWVMPEARHLVVQRGDASLDEMMRVSGSCIYMLNNWYTRVQDARSGRFSTVARDAALVCEGGEVVGWTTRIRIADEFTRVLTPVLVGREVRQVFWWEHSRPGTAPHVLIRARVSAD